MWAITAMFGAIATCCLQAVYGEILFTPFQSKSAGVEASAMLKLTSAPVTQKWLDTGTSTGRFFAFVCSLGWILGCE